MKTPDTRTTACLLFGSRQDLEPKFPFEIKPGDVMVVPKDTDLVYILRGNQGQKIESMMDCKAVAAFPKGTRLPHSHHYWIDVDLDLDAEVTIVEETAVIPAPEPKWAQPELSLAA